MPGYIIHLTEEKLIFDILKQNNSPTAICVKKIKAVLL